MCLGRVGADKDEHRASQVVTRFKYSIYPSFTVVLNSPDEKLLLERRNADGGGGLGIIVY